VGPGFTSERIATEWKASASRERTPIPEGHRKDGRDNRLPA